MSYAYFGADIPQRVVGLKQLEELLGWDRSDVRRVAYVAGSYYRPFDMRVTNSGKWRHIDNPIDPLKALQTSVYRRMLMNVRLPEAVMGGVPGRSVKDNAAVHAGKRTLACLDLASCYPSISHHQVNRVFRCGFGCAPKVANLLTKLTTFERRLPQGAPTSPMMANLVLLPLYEDISVLAQHQGFGFTVWVDDIVLSGEEVQENLGKVVALVQRYGFAVSGRKTKVMHQCHPQNVTGLSTKRGLGVPGPYRQRIRHRIYEIGTSDRYSPQEVNRVWAQIDYVSSICPQQGLSLERLADRYLPARDPDAKSHGRAETRPCKSAAVHARRGRTSHVGDRASVPRV